MIIGLGSDIIDARRIERVIDKYGERFLNRIYTPAERAKADGRKNRVETYAKRYAAKEACAKALGTGFRSGVFWRDLGVVNLLKAITPAGCEAVIDVSLTDEGPTAQAIVVISAVPVASAEPSG